MPREEIITRREQADEEGVDLLSQGRLLLGDANLQSLPMNSSVVERHEVPPTIRVLA
jgi:hypothetical protein